MTGASPLDGLRAHVETIATALAVWDRRREPDAAARRCASDAIDAIDAAVRELHAIRQRLIDETRQADDVAAARADALLRETRDQEER